MDVGAPTGAALQRRPAITTRGLVTALTSRPMLAVLWLAVIIHLAAIIETLPARVNRFDFSVRYAAALALRRHLNPYTTDLRELGDPLGFEIWPLIFSTDTPFFLLCSEPLTLMSPTKAYWTWFGLEILALGVALYLLLGRKYCDLNRSVAWAVAALALLYAPLGDHFGFAQSQIFIVLMLIVMMRCLETNRDATAGMILAAAGALRAFPLLLVAYLALRRRWRALAYVAVGLALIGLVTLAGVGYSITLDFVQRVVFTVQNPNPVPVDIAMSAFLSRMFWDAWGRNPARTVSLLQTLASAVSIGAVLGTATVATLAQPAASDEDWRACSVWVIAAIMLSPVAWVHYLVLLYIPFVQIAKATAKGRCSSRAIWGAVASWLLIAFSIAGRVPAGAIAGHWLFLLVGEGAFVSLLMAYISAYWFAHDPYPASFTSQAAPV
jgi:Glycosyltransferase family 87